MFFISPNAWSFDPFFIGFFLFFIAQICFFVLAHPRFYRRSRIVKVILSVAFVYIVFGIELGQFGAGIPFGQMMDFPLVLNPVSTLPLLVTAVVYLVDIWKPKPESNPVNRTVV
jgi:hypothetical protein